MSASLYRHYLLHWDFSRHVAVGRDVVEATHRLAELPIASDQELCELLQRLPRSAIVVHAMGSNPAHPSQWQTGTAGDLPAREIVNAIARGQLWVTAAAVDQHDPFVARLVDRLTQELCQCHVGLRLIEPHADLVISSPSSQLYYGCDVRPSVLWHLRGRMRLRIYPNHSRFLNAEDLERVARRQVRQNLYFEPALDGQSRVFDMQPGQLISWPHPLPYRIENTEGMNVALRLTFHTKQSLRLANVVLANQILRRLKLDRFADTRTDGLVASLKQVVAGLFRRFVDADDVPIEPTFVLDAAALDEIRSPTEQVDSNQAIAPRIPSMPLVNLPATTLVTAPEN
jgi:hypothetical protein